MSITMYCWQWIVNDFTHLKVHLSLTRLYFQNRAMKLKQKPILECHWQNFLDAAIDQNHQYSVSILDNHIFFFHISYLGDSLLPWEASGLLTYKKVANGYVSRLLLNIVIVLNEMGLRLTVYVLKRYFFFQIKIRVNYLDWYFGFNWLCVRADRWCSWRRVEQVLFQSSPVKDDEFELQ